MTRFLIPIFAIGLSTLLWGLATAPPAKAEDSSRPVDFARDVAPILQSRCVECHNESLRMGFLDLTSHQGMLASDVVYPGDVEESLMIQRLHDRDQGILMPPTGTLEKHESEMLRRWVTSGASWPEDIVITAPAEPAATTETEGIFKILRDGDTERFAACELDAKTLSQTDPRGATPLMYAALYSDVATLRALLKAGADPNRADRDGIAPLILAIPHPDKVKCLLEHGADATHKTGRGRTPLQIAAAYAGNAATIRQLLEAGADPHRADTRGNTPLALAAVTGDPGLLQTILDHYPAGEEWLQAEEGYRKSVDRALLAAVRIGNPEIARRLLHCGAKHDQRTLDSALIASLTDGDRKLAELLIDAGADPDASISSGSSPRSPLLAAVYSENLDASLVELILSHDVERAREDKQGRTALAVARQRGSQPILRLFSDTLIDAADQAVGDVDGRGRDGKHSQQDDAKTEIRNEDLAIRRIVQENVRLLQNCDLKFFAKSGCVACHQHSASMLLVAAARTRGLTADERLTALTVKLTASELAKKRADFFQRITIGGSAHRIGYLLWGLAESGYPSDWITDAAWFELAGLQRADGSWAEGAYRPPTEYTPVSATAVSLRALQDYSPPTMRASTRERVIRATDWLADRKPLQNAEQAFRLLGLTWGHVDHRVLTVAADELLADQLPNGGWAQLPDLPADAYATGLTLYALHESGQVPARHEAYQRGIRFLMETCQDDGTWHVPSRSIKFQPYFESGFPYGHDQWISAAATGWSALALANVLEPDRAGEP